MELFSQVIHALEGSETETRTADTINGPVKVTTTTFGPDRWIEKAQLGRIDAINLLAIILFVIDDFYDEEKQRFIVNEWASELYSAAKSGEVIPRNPITLLKINTLKDDWNWLIDIDEANNFLKNRGMQWTCTEVVKHLAKQCESSLLNQHFPPELFPRKPEQGTPQPASTEIKKLERSRTDALAVELELVCKSLEKNSIRVDVENVWAELSKRAGRVDSCITDTKDGGIVWTRSTGKQATLSRGGLVKRLARMAARCPSNGRQRH